MTAAKRLDVHPLADLPGFPEMEPEPFRSFMDDIKARGQQEPIILYEGKILDGLARSLERTRRRESIPATIR
jgi:ParB-like chromosome segregation protein Spo0J